jgi:hypothetical protein
LLVAKITMGLDEIASASRQLPLTMPSHVAHQRQDPDRPMVLPV